LTFRVFSDHMKANGYTLQDAIVVSRTR